MHALDYLCVGGCKELAAGFLRSSSRARAQAGHPDNNLSIHDMHALEDLRVCGCSNSLGTSCTAATYRSQCLGLVGHVVTTYTSSAPVQLRDIPQSHALELARAHYVPLMRAEFAKWSLTDLCRRREM
jgi:hypothetical protein